MIRAETHIARKVHPRACCNCSGDILPGQQYRRSSATPFDWLNSSPHWAHLKSHVACPPRSST